MPLKPIKLKDRLDKIKKDGDKGDDFNHNISAGLLRLLMFLQEKYPKIYNKIINS